MSEADNVAPVEDNATPAQEGGEVSTFGDYISQHVGEDYKDAGTWEKFKDVDPATALKAIVDMDRYVGKKGDIPSEDASDEARAEFWNKLGADNIELSAPELGEEYGDSRQELGEYYGEIAKTVQDIAAEVVPTAKGINDAIGKIVSKFIEQDAQSTLQDQVAQKQAMDQHMQETANKLGMSVDQMKQNNSEVMKRYGWDDSTSLHEVLNTIAKETSNSQTLKDSLTSTPAGKQSRLEEIWSHPDFFSGGPEYPKLNAEAQRLMADLDKK